VCSTSENGHGSPARSTQSYQGPRPVRQSSPTGCGSRRRGKRVAHLVSLGSADSLPLALALSGPPHASLPVRYASCRRSRAPHPARLSPPPSSTTPSPYHPSLNPSRALSLSLHYLLRAAHLGSSQAQLRIGQAFEHATLDCPFDPLLSVQWYLVASQNGETEADMGLAKWFLVGAEGYLEKNEGLAFSFAEKAAKRGLAAGLFGVGYFYELGIGRTKDLGKARNYYKRVGTLSRHARSRVPSADSVLILRTGGSSVEPRRHHPSRSPHCAHSDPALASRPSLPRRD
jgi:hypothetical protein